MLPLSLSMSPDVSSRPPASEQTACGHPEGFSAPGEFGLRGEQPRLQTSSSSSPSTPYSGRFAIEPYSSRQAPALPSCRDQLRAPRQLTQGGSRSSPDHGTRSPCPSCPLRSQKAHIHALCSASSRANSSSCRALQPCSRYVTAASTRAHRTQPMPSSPPSSFSFSFFSGPWLQRGLDLHCEHTLSMRRRSMSMILKPPAVPLGDVTFLRKTSEQEHHHGERVVALPEAPPRARLEVQMSSSSGSGTTPSSRSEPSSRLVTQALPGCSGRARNGLEHVSRRHDTLDFTVLVDDKRNRRVGLPELLQSFHAGQRLGHRRRAPRDCP